MRVAEFDVILLDQGTVPKHRPWGGSVHLASTWFFKPYALILLCRFMPWPEEALTAVSGKFIDEFKMVSGARCTLPYWLAFCVRLSCCKVRSAVLCPFP